MARCYVLLLGGIGSGKSTVGRMLSDCGADVIDADAVGHEILGRLDVMWAIAEQWPEVITGGAVDRRHLARIVFEDEEQLRLLEEITHPRIRDRLRELVSESEADVVVIEMPILRHLVEGTWFRVVIDVPDGVRLERLVARGMDEADARYRMKVQPDRADWLKVADFVLDNGDDSINLSRQVEAMLGEIEERCNS